MISQFSCLLDLRVKSCGCKKRSKNNPLISIDLLWNLHCFVDTRKPVLPHCLHCETSPLDRLPRPNLHSLFPCQTPETSCISRCFVSFIHATGCRGTKRTTRTRCKLHFIFLKSFFSAYQMRFWSKLCVLCRDLLEAEDRLDLLALQGIR